MAEIPVEKKGSFPWWLLLLGAALLGLLLWMFAAGDDDVDTIAQTTATPAYSVNSAVDFDDARVTELTGDMSFYVEANDGQEYFIVFDEVRTPGTAKEGMLDINVGNYVDITGTMRDRNYNLPSTVQATIPAGEEMFIYATDIDKD